MSFLHYARMAVRKARRDYFNEPRVKGFIGERYVANELKNEPFLLYNLKFKSESDAQIDHLLVSDRGIIVIETKNYGGVIVGDHFSDVWTQYINHHKHNFYNPIRQNAVHVKMVRCLLTDYASAVHSIVVFTPRAELRINNAENVVYLANLRKYISEMNVVLPDEEVRKSIYELLKEACSSS